ncbi:protein FAR1-RELATED SEQUENCE 7-like [Forsythia ovata]|uniref:Protein FAR1-RELATED SEQUENCE 7-like n=1 Tax=Forsythia ovata TaxID=205694 RepID=A0ABD1UDR9_9LAMI
MELEHLQVNHIKVLNSIMPMKRNLTGENIRKEHNHELKDTGENCTPRIQRKSIPNVRSLAGGTGRTGMRSNENDDMTSVVDVKRLKMEDLDGVRALVGEPYKVLEFNYANELYKIYYIYAANKGFVQSQDSQLNVHMF